MEVSRDLKGILVLHIAISDLHHRSHCADFHGVLAPTADGDKEDEHRGSCYSSCRISQSSMLLLEYDTDHRLASVPSDPKI